MSSLRVISWNILNDNEAPKHAKQFDRLDGIIATLAEYAQETPTIILLVEVTTAANTKHIADALGCSHHHSVKYSHNYMSVISNIEPTKEVTLRHHPSQKPHTKSKNLEVIVDSLAINLVHMPQFILSDQLNRLRFVRDILSASEQYEQSIIVGDFNALKLQPSRLALLANGYTAVRPDKDSADVFPSPHFRGKNIPRLTPRLNIDAHYHKGSVIPDGHKRINTEYSDHPLLITDFKLS